MPNDADDRGTQEPARIDVKQDEQLRRWARKLDATPQQLKEAVQAVGDRAADVEAHLKGVRSLSNSERTTQAR